MQALLNEGMRELLTTAADTTSAEPWPCVHALNALCQAFIDKHLALDISGFCAEGKHYLPWPSLASIIFISSIGVQQEAKLQAPPKTDP